MRKRMFCALLLVCILNGFKQMPAHAEMPKIGVCIYNAADTFMSSVVRQIEKEAGDSAEVITMDSANDQNLQFNQVQQMLDENVDALIINPVDRTSAVYLLRLAQRRNIPLVFINREPSPEDLALYDGAYYVGTDPKETGYLCGELVVDWFTEHPEADANGDDIIQYVLLKGEPGHQDAELRTTYTLKAITEAGFRTEKLAEDTALWERSIGQEKMAGFLATWGSHIECVISNNDDMALGAIDALKAAGWFSGGRYMPVVGVDATEPALEALKQGALLGTVLNDAINQGRATWKLVWLLYNKQSITAESLGYPMDAYHRVYIASQKITRETVLMQKP